MGQTHGIREQDGVKGMGTLYFQKALKGIRECRTPRVGLGVFTQDDHRSPLLSGGFLRIYTIQSGSRISCLRFSVNLPACCPAAVSLEIRKGIPP